MTRRRRLLTTAGWVLPLAVVAIGVRFGSRVAGGPDPYGYVSQADLWLHGLPRVPMAIGGQVRWPDGVHSFAPLGYREAPDGAFIVPTYSPGLPLLMAAVKRVFGHAAMFLVVPLCGGLLVWLTARLGRIVTGSAEAGIAAALIVAVSPPFVAQLLYPMSDVPCVAFWTLAVALLLAGGRWSAFLAGLAASVAILIRPNLAPLAIVYAITSEVILRKRRTGSFSQHYFRGVLLLAGTLPGSLAVAEINWSLYGSPLVSGYGNLADVFAWSNAWTNLTRYPAWLLETHGLVIVAGVVALLLPASRLWPTPEARRSAWFFLATAVTVCGLYLFYEPFSDWSYLRFLLPVLPGLAIGTAAVGSWLLEWRQGWLRVVVAVLFAWAIVQPARVVAHHRLLDIGANEDNYVRAATLLKSFTPERSVVYAMQHSGSARYYSGRMTLRYDNMADDRLDQSVSFFTSHGIHPYLLLSDWELDQFRAKFAKSSPVLGRLDWPAIAVTESRVYLFDFADAGRTGPEPQPTRIDVPWITLPAPPPVFVLPGR